MHGMKGIIPIKFVLSLKLDGIICRRTIEAYKIVVFVMVLKKLIPNKFVKFRIGRNDLAANTKSIQNCSIC
jgi:hypothetical protein